MPVIVIGNTVIGTSAGEQIILNPALHGANAVNIEGNGGDDDLTGDARANVIRGGDGNDRLYGGSGMDSLFGDAGHDRFFLRGEWSSSYNQPGGLTHFYAGAGQSETNLHDGGTGFDQLVADEDNLTVVFGSISDLVGDSIEGISGGAYANFRAFFQGDGLQDFTRVSVEDVRLEFSLVDNVIIGSSANQRFDSDNDGDIDAADSFNDASGNDVIDGNAGIDTVIYGGALSRYVIIVEGAGQIRVIDSLGIETGTALSGSGDVLVDVERLQFADQTLDFTPTNWQDTDATAGNAVNGVAGAVSEDAANGAGVGIDVSVDPSSILAGQSVTYALVDTLGGMFAINATTGVVTIGNAALLDYQTAPAINGGPDRGYTITVEATSLGFTSTRTFTVLVAEGNAAPEAPADTNGALDHVIEGAATGTLVGITVQSTDPNGEAVTYSLANNDGGRFQIDAVTGVISVLNGALLDYEIGSLRYVTVRATDSLGAHTDSVFAISLDDFTGDQPIDSDGAFDAVNENAAAGTYTGVTASAVSPTGAPLTYSLVDNAGGRFQINATTGAITVLNGTLLDVEAQSAWNVTVRATDGISTGDQAFTIYLNDVVTETWTGTGSANIYTVTGLGDWVVNGLGGHDTLSAIDGTNVTFIGGTGNDTLTGRNGNDVFLFSGTSAGLDAVSGGDGHDIVRATADNTKIGLSAISGIEEIDSGGFANVSIQLGTGHDVVDSNAIALTGITAIRAGAGNDTIIGTYGNETLMGEDGNDFIHGGAGADILNGGNGIDTVSYAGSWDALTIDLAVNTVSGGDAAGDTIAAFENVIGTDHNDVITGSTAANVLTGGSGDDTMNGGSGNDTFLIGTNSGTDSINGSSGTDTALFTEDNAILSVSALTSIEVFNAAGIANATIAGNELNNSLNFGSATMTNIAGIYGMAGNDTITGSAVADVIIGGDGNDTLNGGNGDDLFRYEDASEGFDNVNGGAGHDILEATAPGVTIGLSAIAGIEAIYGFGDTVILGSSAANTFDFSAVTITGSAINGGGGHDTITGTADYDMIYGGTGNDRLSGYLGSDTLQGDTGADVFDFNSIGDSNATYGEDVIVDFLRGTDKIDVSTIDANAGAAGDQSFAFLGTGNFTGLAGQLKYQNDLGDGYTHVYADIDGDQVVDFHVWLQGNHNLSASDFVL
ncbi:MAG: M10 family metallopeptidase C-terminal domain-containing protein [Beijerinckiaceae bacterium]|nr:M10 family metallopeptidase C-terminal domain-containing protein [Beijerinckiaceae bacterium]MCZ8300264.1 M10 family metallopeptidase C-terminal domain-containing protein [Beijerinckiaceae bacterium]